MAWVWFVLFLLSFVTMLAARRKIRELEDRLGLRGDERATKSKIEDLPTIPLAPGPGTPAAVPVNKAQTRPAVRWTTGETGPAATFTYVDADGVVSDRNVRNWRSDGPHIKAYCLLAGANRTFRKDRIEDWVGMEDSIEL